MIETVVFVKLSVSACPAVASNVIRPPWPGTSMLAVSGEPPAVMLPVTSGGTSLILIETVPVAESSGSTVSV